MNKQDELKFKELIAMITATYEREFNPAKIKLWWNLFKPHSLQAFEQAIYQHIACPDAGMFEPRPANLTKFIYGTSKQNEQALDDKAEIAWHVIEGRIRRVGSYGSLKMEDKQALAAVKAIGGWKKLCGLTMDKMTWAHKEFTAAYKNYDRTPLEALPMNLPGRIELDKHKSELGQSAQGMKALAELVKGSEL